MSSLLVWTVLAIAAPPESDCPSGAAIESYLPAGVRAPSRVKIVGGRLALTVLYPDGQTRERYGIDLPADCDARAQTIAAVVRAWHLSWRPKPPRAVVSETSVLVEMRALRRVRRRMLRRSRTATTTIQIAVSPPSEPQSTSATVAAPAPTEAPPPAPPNRVLASHSPGEQPARKPDNQPPAPSEAAPERPGLPRTNLPIVAPKPRTASRLLTARPQTAPNWSPPRWTALAVGLSAIGSAVALNATKAQKPSAPLPLSLYFVGGAVTIATLVAD